MSLAKICGITNLDDALLAAQYGADELGFNFYPGSPRFIEPDLAREIVCRLPSKTSIVGVFVNEDINSIVKTARSVPLDKIQLHGDEEEDMIAEVQKRTGKEVIRAFRIGPDFKPDAVAITKADAVLIDSFSNTGYGGTGVSIDLEMATKVRNKVGRMYLAGGLNAGNVAAAIETVEPFSVDVCSGVESIKGKKDPVKLRRFLEILKS